jgi:tRNA-specific 2-thiouridylase
VIVDESGRVLASHKGIHRFTVGQRRGLGIGVGSPRYVVSLESDTGTVRVGPKAATVARGLRARNANWLVPALPEPGQPLSVKIRSRFQPVAEGFRGSRSSWPPGGHAGPGCCAVRRRSGCRRRLDRCCALTP